MRLGIIGAGAMVDEFLTGTAPRVAGLEVLGLLARPRSLDRARDLASRTGVPLVTDSLDELCASGIDTVYVAVPHVAHAACAAQALERGLHGLVECVRTVDEDDRQSCYAALERSVAVSRVQTATRLGAGIRFPADG